MARLDWLECLGACKQRTEELDNMTALLIYPPASLFCVIAPLVCTVTTMR